jgi:hypothetical protein
MNSNDLVNIPLVDLRGRTPSDLLRDRSDVARALIESASNTHGFVSRFGAKLLLPLADKVSRSWLERTKNPYLAEIDAMAKVLQTPGTYALNLSYEWGCTSGAFNRDGAVTLLRVLDWPFPDLGKHVMVIHQEGAAGEFYNVGWPGLSGMLNGMAPGRFAATLNQAPMRRHGWLMPIDWALNRRLVENASGLPPAHLLRKIFEEARNYEEAKKMAMDTPVALPVIFILSGLKPGEGCVIERTENSAATIDLGTGDRVTAANHFTSPLAALGKGWRPRSEDSPERLLKSCSIDGSSLAQDDFAWLEKPIINDDSRLIVVSDASAGRLIVQGIEGDMPVSKVFQLTQVGKS